MSRHHPSHPVPRAGIDPIRCADDALAVLALGAPYGADTVVILLDAERRGSSVLVVDVCVEAARRLPEVTAVILASSRPGGDLEPDDVHRWLEACDQCRAGGLVLVEWFVLGRSGPRCPRELVGEPDRWAT